MKSANDKRGGSTTMVTINSGPLEPTDRFQDVSKDKWDLLLIAKRSFLLTNLRYDCRCLIDFCEEAELVYAELGFASAEEMIREGYELDPSQIELAVAWLKSNGTEKPIGLDDIGKKIAEAKANKESQQGKRSDLTSINFIEVAPNSNGAVLRRLARDCPEMLDKIEAGEISVNAAAIQAGIRKKPKPEEVCVKAFAKVEQSDRVAVMHDLLASLSDDERAKVLLGLANPQLGR